MHLRCYRCAAWQHAAPRDVPPIGLDVWVCRVCKRDQFARDGAMPKMREHMLWLLEKEQRERAKNKTGRPPLRKPAGNAWRR